jgi:biopolymer transport protein ExbD
MKKVIYCALFALQTCALVHADGTNAPTLAVEMPEGQKLADLYWNAPGMDAPSPGNPSPELTLSWEKPADPDDRSLLALTIKYTGTSTLQKRLLQLPYYPGDDGVSSIMTQHYAITGEVSYENAAPGSYLEMWSFFNPRMPGYPEGAYFSRTLGNGGPMGAIGGTSDWRRFWLPFDATGMPSPPIRLEVNLHLSGAGTVHLRSMKLIQYPSAAFAAVHVPPAPAATATRTAVRVALTPDHSAPVYSIDGKTYPDIAAVQSELSARHNTDSQVQVVVEADKTVPYDDIRAMLDAAKDAGISQISFATVSVPPTAGNDSALDASSPARMDWRSFFLGILACLATLLLIGAAILLSRSWQRRQHERELRRMASLDS